MPRTVLLVNVELHPDKRKEYIGTTQLLQRHLEPNQDIVYVVFENQGKVKDSFTEMFIFNSADVYDAFDEADDDRANELFARILAMSKRSPVYTTLVEVE